MGDNGQASQNGRGWRGRLLAAALTTLTAALGSAGALALSPSPTEDPSLVAFLGAGIGALASVVVILWQRIEKMIDRQREDLLQDARADQALADALDSLTRAHEALSRALLEHMAKELDYLRREHLCSRCGGTEERKE